MSIFLNQIAKVLSKALVVFKYVYIEDFNKEVTTQQQYNLLEIEFTYYDNATSNTALTEVSTSTGIGITFEVLAAALASDLKTIMGAQERELDKITLKLKYSPTGLPEQFSIKANQFTFHHQHFSMLQVQNTTVASSGTAGADNLEASNITNNPLAGRKYWVNGNGFMPKVRRGQTVSLLASPVTGQISATATTMGGNFQKPPQASQFIGGVKSTTCRMEPGAIYRNSISNTQSHNLMKFFKKHWQDFDQVTIDRITLGKSFMFGLEKLLYNRTEADTITYNWEINQHFKIGYSYNPRTYTVPITTIV